MTWGWMPLERRLYSGVSSCYRVLGKAESNYGKFYFLYHPKIPRKLIIYPRKIKKVTLNSRLKGNESLSVGMVEPCGFFTKLIVLNPKKLETKSKHHTTTWHLARLGFIH